MSEPVKPTFAAPAAGHGDRAHAWVSPSALARVLACNAAPVLCAGAPPEVRDPTGPAAWGEAAHEKAQRHLDAWTDPEGEDEHADVLAPYLAAVREAYGGIAGKVCGRDMIVEKRVDIYPPDCWGTLDAAVVDPFDFIVHIFDLKTGTEGVPAKENAQLGGYACGILRKYAGTNPKSWAGWTVRLSTVGARRLDGGPAVDTWESTGEWCAALHKRIVSAVKASRAETQPVPVAGPHCHYCRAAPLCPARLSALAAVFPVAEHANPSGDPAGEITGRPVEPGLLAPEVLARVLSVEDQILDWLRACRAHALANPPPGWKVVAGRKGARKWVDDKTAVAALKGAGLDPYEAPKPKSPTTVEKLIGKGPFAETFAPLTQAAPGSPTLAPADDPRPGISYASAFPAGQSPDDAAAPANP